MLKTDATDDKKGESRNNDGDRKKIVEDLRVKS